MQELYLHSACHTGVPTWAVLPGDGTVRIICAACEKVIEVLPLSANYKHPDGCCLCSEESEMEGYHPVD